MAMAAYVCKCLLPLHKKTSIIKLKGKNYLSKFKIITYLMQLIAISSSVPLDNCYARVNKTIVMQE